MKKDILFTRVGEVDWYTWLHEFFGDDLHVIEMKKSGGDIIVQPRKEIVPLEPFALKLKFKGEL